MIATHLMDEADVLADRIAIMSGVSENLGLFWGRIIFCTKKLAITNVCSVF